MGAVVISIDAELAWGFHDRVAPPVDRIRAARPGWKWLIEELDQWQLPATWAVVGHLFLDSCSGRHETLATPPKWFDSDPGGTQTTWNNWYGPDLIAEIKDASVSHDIGSHTFSHLSLGNSEVTPEMLRDDLTKWCELAESWGIRPGSFVYPRNVIGYRPVLADLGFRGYRGRSPVPWYEKTAFQPITKTVSLYSGGASVPIVHPRVDEFGLVDVPASLYLYGFEGSVASGICRLVGDPILKAARTGIETVATEDGIFHLWLHPNNLVSSEDRRRLREILTYIDEIRRVDGLEVYTMNEVIDQYAGS